jgi:hypothetical protein
MDSLIFENPNNPYSVSYYKNYKIFKEFYENQLYKNRQKFLEPIINFADEAKIYIDNPYVLLIEKEQYEIYNFKIFLTYSYNQFDIWVLLFKSIELFIKTISIETNNIILQSDESTKKLIEKYPLDEQNNYLKEIGAEGIRATYDRSSDKLTWFLVKNDGTRAIDNKNNSFEELYVNYIGTSVKAYDAIILYIYLLEILCLRQNRVYVAEENVGQLNIEYSLILNKYYDIIIETINNKPKDTKIYIPPSILWDVSNLNSLKNVQNKQKINDKQYIIYRTRINSIAESRQSLVASCDKISKIITPNISKTGFIEQCNDIIRQISNIMPHTFRSSYWLNKTIKNYNIQKTNDFIYNMTRVVKDAWHDKIIDDYDEKDYLDWIVFYNDKFDIDSLYASVADGLNGQLEITNSETTNPYTREIEGQKLFTVDSLKELVTEFNNKQNNPFNLTDNYEIILMILEKTLKIKLIIFGMFNDNKPIQPGNSVLYDKRPYRILSIKTSKDNNSELYDLYDGYIKITDVLKEDIQDNPDDLFKNFWIYCNDDNLNMDFTDYMYILMTKHKDRNTKNIKFKYQLVKALNKPYILTGEEISIYIKYLIFNSCQISGEQQLRAMGFGNQQIRDNILNFANKRSERIQKINIDNDIMINEQQINEYTTKYKQLKKNKSKTLEQQFEEIRLRKDIKDLKEIINNLKINKDMIKSNVNKSGGANTLKPSEQYSSFVPQYNPLGYQLNQNVPSNIVYLPRQGYSYPYQNYYSKQYNVPYNIAQNKAKDQKSKLSFYITIELELFPGTSANMLQKSFVKCQSTFERIREAWSDIFGFEYRPAPMNEAYAYNLEALKKDNKTNTKKKRTKKKNRTRKLNL